MMSENASSRRSALISAVCALFVAQSPSSTKEAASDASMLWPRPQTTTLKTLKYKRPNQTRNMKCCWDWRGAVPYAYVNAGKQKNTSKETTRMYMYIYPQHNRNTLLQ